MNSTRTYAYATNDGHGSVHVCGYQNSAANLSEGPNCMFLNFAGSDLALVRGPEHTTDFMDSMTAGLDELVYVPKTRGGFLGGYGFEVHDYGDYTVVLAQEAGSMVDALELVLVERRPRARQIEHFMDFYHREFPGHSYVLACFNGKVKPKHPIVVQYRPHNPDVLTIPGLDGHDGQLPKVGAPVQRDFKVAFAVAGAEQPHPVRYRDSLVNGAWWAPSSVGGFIDNRPDGKNGDYVVPVEAVRNGLTGRELADQLQ